MRAIDLETKVITAVDQIRAGQQVEHDFIECKRDWPQESKARQLAASLNRAGGDPVIYIIGIDEKTAEISDVIGTEVSDWWGQITPKFDQAPPEMVRHMSVPVGDEGEHVVAVAFASDRAPYVVKTGLGNPTLEIPIREGTSTRTARRDELLRMLIPAVRLPQIVVLEADLYAAFHPALPPLNAFPGRDELLTCSGQLKIYVEHNGSDIVTMPAHGMSGRITVVGEKFELDVVPPMETATAPSGLQTVSFQRPSDGVIISGPRSVSLGLTVRGLTPQEMLLFHTSDEIELEVALEVLHSTKPMKINVTLMRDGKSNMGVDDEAPGGKTPGSWRFKHPGVSLSD